MAINKEAREQRLNDLKDIKTAIKQRRNLALREKDFDTVNRENAALQQWEEQWLKVMHFG
jgi:hypothetical protein